MKIFVKEVLPGNHTKNVSVLISEHITQVGDYLQILINNDKVYDCQVCSVHRCYYWDSEPEMLSSVVLKVRKI